MDLLSSLGINSTFYIQLVNFVVLVVILKFLLYKPLMDSIETRRKDAESIKNLKQELEDKLSDIDKMYARKLEEATSKVEDILGKARKSAEIEAQKIIESAKKEKAKLIEAYQAELNKQLKEHKLHLKEEVLNITLSVFKGLFSNDRKLKKQVTDKIIELLNEKE